MTSSTSGLALRGTIGGEFYHSVDPMEYYRAERKDLFVSASFRTLVVANAKIVRRGNVIKAERVDLLQDMIDADIEAMLPMKHFFDETPLCGLIASLISHQTRGEEGPLGTEEFGNLFYTHHCVVIIRWSKGSRRWNVSTWQRDESGWNAGERVFCPAA